MPDPPADEERRRYLGVLLLIFVLVLTGCFSPPDSVDGTGELVVSVQSQRGNPIANTDVIVREPSTGDVIFQGTTGPNGKVSTTLETGTYKVAADGTTATVEIEANETTSTEIEVFRAPPKLTESAHPHRVRRSMLHC